MISSKRITWERDIGAWILVLDMKLNIIGCSPVDHLNQLRGLKGIRGIADYYIEFEDSEISIEVAHREIGHFLIRKRQRLRRLKLDLDKVAWDRGILVHKAGVYLPDIFSEGKG